MNAHLRRGIAATVLVAALGAAGAGPALAAAPSTHDGGGGVVVVDEPDTSNLNNMWTFAPFGIPVFGLLQALGEVPGKLAPGQGGY